MNNTRRRNNLSKVGRRQPFKIRCMAKRLYIIILEEIFSTTSILLSKFYIELPMAKILLIITKLIAKISLLT